MLPTRQMRQLCVLRLLLLLGIAATAAVAQAPPYATGEVVIKVKYTPFSTTRHAQMQSCFEMSGVLVPMVTEAVYRMVSERMEAEGFESVLGYMGGSTMLSSSECKAGTPSLSCIWYWDQGRYNSSVNAVAFYKGNLPPSALNGAGMLGTLVGDHWGSSYGTYTQFPGRHLERYGVVVRPKTNALMWADSSPTEWSYVSSPTPYFYYSVCASEQSIAPPPVTTAVPPHGKGSGVSLPLILGISAGVAVAVGAIIVFVMCLPCCCGWCCFARPSEAANTTSAASSRYSRGTASQWTEMSRRTSFRSSVSGFADDDVRSFHSRAPRKAEWRSGDDMASVAASQRHMGMSQMMAQQNCEAPMPVHVYTSGPRDSEVYTDSSIVASDD